MDNLLTYLLEANVLLAALTGIYFLVRNGLSFSQRRFSLLAIPVLACAVFFFRSSGVSENTAVYQLPIYEVDALALPPIEEWQNQQITFWPAYDRIYLIGVVITLLIAAIKIGRLLVKLRRAKTETRDGLTVVHLNDEPCFSFLNYVQLNPALPVEQQELILEHEKIHVTQKHSYDKLFMTAAQSINWFNPVFMLIKKELSRVHEYEVDQLMYQRHQTSYMEFLLAYSLRTNSTPPLLTNQFFSKNGLIKRLHFMKKQPKNNWALALAIPMVAGAFALVSWNFSEAKKQADTIEASNYMIETDAEKMPEFKGGQEALFKYMSDNIVYPEAAKKGKIEGTVYVSFLVEASGKISNCNVKRSVQADLDAEALRVVKSMPDWIPGEKEGKSVNMEMILPVSFKM